MNEQGSLSWWIFRDLEGTALDVDDAEPDEEIMEAPNGIWIGKVERADSDTYNILKRVWPKREQSEKKENIGLSTGGEYVVVRTIHRITKTEYETYQAFGLFDG